jgi:PPOX class probable F420-dependent enzyme
MMTIEGQRTMSGGPLSVFDGETYLSLESYRRNGQAVATPVWFAQDRNIIYIYSLADAFKVKRIRNNPRVRIAPCGARGQLKGEWVEARARILSGDEERRADSLLDEKYGWMKKLGNLFSKIRKRQRAFIAIEST